MAKCHLRGTGQQFGRVGSIGKSFCKSLVALSRRHRGLWECAAIPAGGSTRGAGWDVLPPSAGLEILRGDTRSQLSPGSKDTAQGDPNSPTHTQEIGGGGKKGGGRKSRSQHCNARQLLLQGEGGRGLAEEQGRGQGLAVPCTGQSRVSRSSSPGRVSGTGAPRGCSGGAGTRQRRFPSRHGAPKARSPAVPTGFSSAQRRVGMCRGFSWSSLWSEAALGLGLSRARSCR